MDEDTRDTDLGWTPPEGWETWEVNREGDTVTMYLATSEATMGLQFSPEDAQAIGMALIQAGQEVT